MIYILTGPVASGKTTFLWDVGVVLKAQDIPCDGYLSLRISKGDETIGYDLFDLQIKRTTPFLRTSGQDLWQKVGPYYILPEGLTQAEKIIRRSPSSALLILDEIGPLELEGQGVWPALSEILFDHRRYFLLVIRQSLLHEYSRILEQAQVEIFAGRNRRGIADIIRKMKSHDRQS
jgi:nucleoside-triphosphatase THEP1